jgi:magnesium transporter
MHEIEVSSRLYMEEDVPFMTALVIFHADTPTPDLTPITFVLVRSTLITIRYAEPASFRTFLSKIERRPFHAATAERVTCGLLEAVTDRIADILERAAADLDQISRDVFSSTNGAVKERRKRRDLISKARESVVSLSRLVSYLGSVTKSSPRKGLRNRLKTITRDVVSLRDHAAFESSNVNFLLDATLGMINIEQNSIIKTFTVASVAFMPPTLVASIYGMNFKFLPELNWEFGYGYAIGLMVLSAILPLVYFKWRRWL